MSADGSTIVPVDVVQGIVQQLATVSQHTTSATTAMRHLVSEIAGLRELRQRDTTTMVEALADVTWRSGSPGVIEGGGVRTTDPAIRKLQEKDPEFPKYDGNPEHFFGVVRGSGRAEGVKAVVGSGSHYLCDGGVGRTCERYGGRW